MLKSITLAIGIILLGGVGYVIFFMSPDIFNWNVVVPPRPANVPSEAVWSGGAMGGNFIWCDVSPAADKNHCVVYSDDDGSIYAEADFRLQKENRAARHDELSYNGFDGQVIHLMNGDKLVPDHELIAGPPGYIER